MKKKKYLIIFVVFILLLIVFEVFIKIDSPSFFDEKIKDLKNDSLLMKDIGGFRKYEYFYNENQLESDTLKFKIIIYGKNKNLVNEGQAIKNENNEWKIIKDMLHVQE